MRKKTHILLFITVVLLNSCIKINPEEEIVVKEKTKTYLKDKYSKNFEIKKFHQYFHTFDWQYETTLIAFPLQDSTLTFLVDYDAKKKKVLKDEYKKVFWERQIENDAAEILKEKFSDFSVKAKLYYNKTVPLLSSDMEFYNNYLLLIKEVNLPVLHLEIFIIKNISDAEPKIENFAYIEDYLSEKTFIETEIEIYFYDESLLNDEKTEDLNKIKLKLRKHKYKKYRKRRYRFKFAEIKSCIKKNKALKF